MSIPDIRAVEMLRLILNRDMKMKLKSVVSAIGIVAIKVDFTLLKIVKSKSSISPKETTRLCIWLDTTDELTLFHISVVPARVKSNFSLRRGYFAISSLTELFNFSAVRLSLAGEKRVTLRAH